MEGEGLRTLTGADPYPSCRGWAAQDRLTAAGPRCYDTGAPASQDLESCVNIHCGFQTGEQINVSGRPRTGECNRFERYHHRVKDRSGKLCKHSLWFPDWRADKCLGPSQDRNALQNHLRLHEDQQQTVEMILPCVCRRTDLLRSAESSQRRSAEKLFPHMCSLDPETQHHHS
ncbi:hypothetical protein MHYP_G00092720 [Metynnis hypsauchen]